MEKMCSESIEFKDVWNILLENSPIKPSSSEESLLKQALEYRPQLKPFILVHASRTLPEYGKKIASTSGTLSDSLKDVVRVLISRAHGEESASTLLNDITTLTSIDTSGHGGILSEDTLIQSHGVIASGVKKLGFNSFLSLACGVVPMNNSTWPRGYFVLGGRESIFPKSFDRVAFHECRAFTKEMLDKKLSDSGTSNRARAVLSEIKNVAGVFDQQMFHQQATLINHSLWNNTIADGTPRFFQLLLEEVTAELVIRSIEADDALARVIFCDTHRDLFFRELANLPGTWSPDKTKGTYLFWHASGDFRAASLFPEGNSLKGSSINVPLTPDGVVEALQSRTIVPSVFLSLVTLLHHGVRPLGGYHQIWYLPEYRKRLARFAAEVPDIACPEFLAKISLTDLFQLGYGLAFYRDNAEPSHLAGVDTFITQPGAKKEFWNTLETTTVATAVLSNINRWYAELVPASKRKESVKS